MPPGKPTDKIEGAILKTTQGVEISSSVAQGLNEIASKVRQVNEIVNEVANTSNEQTLGVTQINTAVSQIDNVTQSNCRQCGRKRRRRRAIERPGPNHETVGGRVAPVGRWNQWPGGDLADNSASSFAESIAGPFNGKTKPPGSQADSSEYVQEIVIMPMVVRIHTSGKTPALERIADHAKNIAEEVVFLCDALDIRHVH